MDERRCGIGEGFDNHCPNEGRYEARWTNGDQLLLCAEHAATVREISPDLEVLKQTDGSNEAGEPRG
ncbi:MAG: hypothetical protein JWP14_3398 [Frankiales bacterium]|nr:hypothetical protein [Frankiales bacterium]